LQKGKWQAVGGVIVIKNNAFAVEVLDCICIFAAIATTIFS